MLKASPAMALKSQNKTQNKSKKSLNPYSKNPKKKTDVVVRFLLYYKINQSILSAKECVDVGLHFTLSALFNVVKIPQAQVNK